MPGQDPEYNEDEGAVRIFIRGRPVHFEVPTNRRESYNPQRKSLDPPSELTLEWVYGYRGRDCRNNVVELPTGEILYFIAAVGVLYHVEEKTQRHYLGHTDDIRCMAVHPNKETIATGQVPGHGREAKPHIRVWSSSSLDTLHVLGFGEFDRPLVGLAFSQADGGSTLAAVEDDPSAKILSVWDWAKGENGSKITHAKAGSDDIVGICFSNNEAGSLVTCGKSHVNFWTLEEGDLKKRTGIFGNREKPKYISSIVYTSSGEVVSGDTSGNIILWEKGENTISRVVKAAHQGAVLCMLPLEDGGFLSGGKDCQIVQWDASLEFTGDKYEVPNEYGSPRVIAGTTSQLKIGTTKNCILLGAFGETLSPIVQGHTSELWALAIHPSSQQFVTADQKIYLHCADSHEVLWTHDLEEKAQSATFAIDASVLIVGCVNGKWLIINLETKEIISEHQDGDEPIQVLKFSPNGEYLAVGSRDNFIYVYKYDAETKEISKVGKCQGHSSFITHLDWSRDSELIQSNSGDYELLYWNANDCSQITSPSDTCDVAWATQSCTLSFATLGIWQDGGDGTDINACNRSHDARVLATADDFGKVKLFAYPACQSKSKFKEYGGHSSHVTDVQFSHDNSKLLSTGGLDTAVLQWHVQ
ncbi:unnamed protein product [Meganyctiphanes norvegica]|uniref:Echinoderm microtubule-associated protein-like 2 n=1 Tax=Meganyctiphanes norvegica TaxID=48144 RepID=A0AAV2Q5H8_MEGNR